MKKIRSEAAAERSCTAGADAGGQQAGGVVLESERDRRTYAWLLENFGAEAVNRAVAGLAYLFIRARSERQLCTSAVPTRRATVLHEFREIPSRFATWGAHPPAPRFHNDRS